MNGTIKNQLHRCLEDGNLSTKVIILYLKKLLKKTGQVCIQIRDVQGVDDNPFDFETVKKKYRREIKSRI